MPEHLARRTIVVDLRKIPVRRKLTGGLAMQDRLKDQGVHSGSVLFIARDEEDTLLAVHDSVHEDVRPREHWGGERDQYRRRRQGRSQGQPAREWARSWGHRDMVLEWGDTGRDGSACTRVCILLYRNLDTPIRLLRNSQSTTALRRQKS